MARPIHKLTVLTISRARRDGRYGDGGGLYLQVDGGSKSWLFRYKRGEQTHYMGFGPVDMVSIDEARARALECRKLLHAGLNPVAAREAERAKRQLEAARTLTFDACVDAYLKAHKAGWRNPKHRQQWENTLKTYASPMFGGLPVRDIDVALVMRVIEPIWSTKPETASRLRGRIESVLGWATIRGYRSGDNPARWRGRLDHLLPARNKVRDIKHHAALPYAELPAFMAALHGREGNAARALEFLILTSVRTGDIIGNNRDDAPPMKWEHLDLRAQLWTIPKTKANTEHRVPLSSAAAALLKRVASESGADGIVFRGIRPGEALSNGSMLRVLDRMGRDDLTVHGFRATFKTWASERTNFAREVIEAALAHAISDKLEAAYRRGDFLEKRKRLMTAWAEFCIMAAPETGQLLRLKARA